MTTQTAAAAIKQEMAYTRAGKLIPAAVLEQKRAAGLARAKQFTSESQRAAGLALKEQVSQDFFKSIGLLGWRVQKFNLYKQWAITYDIRSDKSDYHKEYTWWRNRYSPEIAERMADKWNADMRKKFEEEAERYSPAGMGTRWILEFFRAENDLPKPKRGRKPKAAKAKVVSNG